MEPMELLNGVDEHNLDPALLEGIGNAVRAALPNASPAERKAAAKIARNAARASRIKQPMNARESAVLANLKRVDPGLYNDYMQGKLMARTHIIYLRDRLTGIESELALDTSLADKRGRSNLNNRKTNTNSLVLAWGVSYAYGAGSAAEIEPGNVQFVQQAVDAAFTTRIPTTLQAGEVQIKVGETDVIKLPISGLINRLPAGTATNGDIVKQLDSPVLIKGGTDIAAWVRAAVGVTLPANFGGFTPASHFSEVCIHCLELIRRS
jgi:hypothetical protein